jgi:pterin-4a-carbinolamine dehydratase
LIAEGTTFESANKILNELADKAVALKKLPASSIINEKVTIDKVQKKSNNKSSVDVEVIRRMNNL